MTFVPVADPDEDDDPEWWELDSSESIPATAARPGLRTTATPVMAPAAPARAALGRDALAEPAVASAEPRRPRWVTYAAIAVSAVIGGITYAVTSSFVSTALRSKPTTVADQPRSGGESPASTVAESASPQLGPVSGGEASGTAAHQAVIDTLAAAYNDIADGYARIRDAASIPLGEERVAHAVERLKSAAESGRSLPPLEPAERAAFARSSGPPLLRAVDRVIGELRRLKATPGLKSNFARLIDAYTRTRQEIDREIQGNPSGPPAQFGPGPRPQPSNIPRPGPMGPRGRLRGRR
jgi:hypothetical protein